MRKRAIIDLHFGLGSIGNAIIDFFSLWVLYFYVIFFSVNPWFMLCVVFYQSRGFMLGFFIRMLISHFLGGVWVFQRFCVNFQYIFKDIFSPDEEIWLFQTLIRQGFPPHFVIIHIFLATFGRVI